jgi:hypothetical protein
MMVYNYNREEGKNVEFILYQNNHNYNLHAKYKIKQPQELLDIIKGAKK